ncbi:MAG: cobyric acid synthase [Paracoccus sp. (in: a-proteobacteria)]|nr:cobyric acid synthase [Paracoccus sp. (in: a-proteobacteria)]
MRCVMIQGTGSNVGKSLLVAGLCRAFTRRGLRVRPFKPQNMSNNAAATPDGGEIGRAQAMQAMACGVSPSVDMNPVLLKPESETGAQIIVQGKLWGRARAADYRRLKPQLMGAVLDSFQRLSDGADLVIVEGAGSPAEINLREADIANMGFARAAAVPVVLAGDIDRGGVIAQIVGTQAVIAPDDAAMIKGFLVNKFRGDSQLFDDGYAEISRRTGWPGLGVLPWFPKAHLLPAEDAADLRRSAGRGAFLIAVPQLPRIANFDDLDPLMQEPGLSVELVPPGRPLPRSADMILLPGSKSTMADLAALRAEGWDRDIAAARERGAWVMGLCGGYQMLGQSIADPGGVEGQAHAPGLGLLDVTTTISAEKTVRPVHATDRASGLALEGYEIHLGRTTGPDCARAPFVLDGRPEGAASPDGRVIGSYLHGLFSDDAFRSAFLAHLGVAPSRFAYRAGLEQVLDELAEHIARHLDLDLLLQIAAQRPRPDS